MPDIRGSFKNIIPNQKISNTTRTNANPVIRNAGMFLEPQDTSLLSQEPTSNSFLDFFKFSDTPKNQQIPSSMVGLVIGNCSF